MLLKGKSVTQRIKDRMSIEDCLAKCGAAVELEIGITLTAYVYSNNVDPEDLIIETVDLTNIEEIEF